MAQEELITIDQHTFKAFEGPNLTRISKNFYADKTEVTNSFYKEYLHWIKTAYGIKSHEYINALPNAAVWAFNRDTDISFERYFRSAEFDDFPVVGITLKQAKDYADWRTNRVAEMLLITKGYLQATPNSLDKNNFTVEKYRNGKFELTKELDSILVFPEFKIPTIEEWDALAGINSEFNNGIDSLTEYNKTFLKNSNIHNAHFQFKSLPINSYKYGCKNIYGLYHTIGNVSELVDQAGIAKGSDWKYPTDKIDPSSNTKQNIPNSHTGFRCVARLNVLKK